MKESREILLKHHRSVEPKLDRIWAESLATELQSEAMPTRQNVFLAVGWTLWRELVLPSRRIWAGLACAWLLIAVLNLASSEPSTKVASKVQPPSHEEIQARAAHLPMGRYTEPEEVANGCIYLASDEAAGISGTDLNISAGCAVRF